MRCLMMLSAFLSLLSCPIRVIAERPPSSRAWCFLGCQTALSGQVFAGSPTTEAGYYVEECHNLLHVQSMYACARQHCSEQEVSAGTQYMNDECLAYGLVSFLGPNVVSNLSSQPLGRLPTLAYGEYPTEIDTIIVPDQDLFDLGYRTINVWYSEWSKHLMYSEAMFIFWGVVIFIGICCNALTRLRSVAVPDALYESSSAVREHSALQRFWRATRARIILPASFGYRYHTPTRIGTIPSRLETSVICIYVVINVVLCAVQYHTFARNLYWSSPDIQTWRYFSDRTGFLAYANIAIMWLFAVRNNILLWVSGWSFATFSRFHRWVARVATLQAVLHSVGYTVFSFKEGGYDDYSESWTEQYWYCGNISTISMALLIGLSFFWFRVKLYDFFLLLHIAFALVTLVGLFYHTRIFLGEFDGFLWPCVAFWSFDRAVRIGRVLFYWIQRPSSKAEISYNPDAEIVRIDLTSIVGSRGAKAGAHYFIYTPTRLFGWESHPFTLVRWLESDSSSLRTSSSEGLHKETSDGKQPKTATAQLSISSQASSQRERYGLIIRPHDGFTSRLRRYAQNEPKAARVFVEGPYGKSPKLDSFADILMIIGGSGVTVAIPCIYKALEQTTTCKIRLVWAMRRAGLLRTVVENELDAAYRSDRLTIDAYVTGTQIEQDFEKQSTSLARAQGRPDVGRMVREATASCPGRLAVLVCGPATMSDDTRAAVVSELKHGQADVHLFVENFSW